MGTLQPSQQVSSQAEPMQRKSSADTERMIGVKGNRLSWQRNNAELSHPQMYRNEADRGPEWEELDWKYLKTGVEGAPDGRNHTFPLRTFVLTAPFLEAAAVAGQVRTPRHSAPASADYLKRPKATGERPDCPGAFPSPGEAAPALHSARWRQGSMENRSPPSPGPRGRRSTPLQAGAISAGFSSSMAIEKVWP